MNNFMRLGHGMNENGYYDMTINVKILFAGNLTVSDTKRTKLK